jgi:hypothetical protein
MNRARPTWKRAKVMPTSTLALAFTGAMLMMLVSAEDRPSFVGTRVDCTSLPLASATEVVKHPPDLALQPDQITKLPAGEMLTRLTAPRVHGGIRILPTGSGPSNTPPDELLAPSVRYSRWSTPSLDCVPEAARAGLLIPPYIPSGWQFATAFGEIAQLSEDRQLALFATLEYERDGYFPLAVLRRFVGSQLVDLVNPEPATMHALTLAEIGAMPVVIGHQAPGAKIQAIMSISYVQRGFFTRIESPALDLDELIQIASSLIAAGEQ